jgi:tetratricopeptide (TPR) repeat protein
MSSGKNGALPDASSAAHAGLGSIHVKAASQGYSLDRDADLLTGERHLARALALDPTNTAARFWRGLALERRWRFDEALAEYDLIIATNTNVARAMGARGTVMLETDRLEEAIAASREALRISPLDGGRATWIWQIGVATRRLGREEEALPHFIRAASLAPLHEGFWAHLIATYALVGRQAEAAATLREGLARWPGLTIAHFRRRASDWSPYPGYQAGYERYLEGLRLAGMPEE